jgi:DNA-binding LacI/PurR family transcriptional regulator
MSGNTPVGEKTRAKVLESVSALNYRTNLFARGLRTQSGRLLGLVVPEILHETFATFIAYVEQACQTKGFVMILGNTRDDLKVERRVLDNFIGLNVDGIIISQVADGSSILRGLKQQGIPCVGIDRALEEEYDDQVIVDNYEAGKIAAEHFYFMGHRRLACIQGPKAVRLSRERYSGFCGFFKSVGIEVVSVAAKDFEFESGAVAARSLLKSRRTFTGVWAENDLLAIGAMSEFCRVGMRVPEDVSVMGMDDIPASQMVHPSLTTIKQPYQDMCEKAVELLISRIREPSLPARRFVLPSSLVVRNSVRKIQSMG